MLYWPVLHCGTHSVANRQDFSVGKEQRGLFSDSALQGWPSEQSGLWASCKAEVAQVGVGSVPVSDVVNPHPLLLTRILRERKQTNKKTHHHHQQTFCLLIEVSPCDLAVLECCVPQGQAVIGREYTQYESSVVVCHSLLFCVCVFFLFFFF